MYKVGFGTFYANFLHQAGRFYSILFVVGVLDLTAFASEAELSSWLQGYEVQTNEDVLDSEEDHGVADIVAQLGIIDEVCEHEEAVAED